MAFIHKIIAPDEKLIGIARLHWIYGLKGLLWLVGLMGSGIVIKFYLYDFMGGAFAPVANALFWMGTIVGVILALFYIIMMLTTELGLTTKKCIYKHGWIFVDTREVDLEEIKSTDVDNGILGRFLNYGYIHMDARFIEDVGLPAIADPYRFLKALNVVKTEIKDDSMKVILNDGSVKQNEKINALEDKEEDINTLEHSDYEALPDDAINNIKEVVSIDHDLKNNNKPKRSDYIKSAHDETKPLKKNKKEHLKEEIIDDFEEVEGDTHKK